MADHGSKWTHVLCVECWELLNPGRMAALVKTAEPEPCCRCGKQADPPIYVRGAWEDFHPGEWRED